MTTTLQVVQAFDTYKVGDQITVSDTVAQALQKAYPGRFQFVSADASSGGSSGGGTTTPTTPSTGSGLTLSDVDAEIATAFVAKGVPAGQTVPGLINAAIAAQGTGSGISAAQAAALSIVLG